MLEAEDPLAERGTDLLGFALEEPGPGRVVVDELDRLAVNLDLAEAPGLELGLSLRRHRGQVARTGVKSRDQSLYATRGVSVSSGVDAP